MNKTLALLESDEEDTGMSLEECPLCGALSVVDRHGTDKADVLIQCPRHGRLILTEKKPIC